MKKKILSLVVMIAVITAQFGFVSVYLPKVSAETTAGICGDNATWTLDTDTKTLNIEGFGAMYDYSPRRAPWNEYGSFIKNVVFSEGITHIGGSSFYDIYFDKVTIPSTVETIGGYAFGSYGNVKEFDVSENIRLREFEDFFKSSIKKTTWYNNLPDGPVYFANLLCGYKGEIPENYCLEVKEGTYSINIEAFLNQSNLVDIVIPDSVIYMGRDALKNTGWYNVQPDGAVYAGKILYEYRGTPSINDKEFTVAEGTVSIAPGAFSYKLYISAIHFPSTVKAIGERAFFVVSSLETVDFGEGCELEFIGKSAFESCQRLSSFDFEGIDEFFPESLTYIGNDAFRFSSKLKKTVNIPEGVNYIGESAFAAGGVVAYDVAENNKYYINDEYNILYNKNKTVLVAAPVTFENKEVVIPETVKEIRSHAFERSSVSKVTLPDGIEDLGKNTFVNSMLKEINIPDTVTVLKEFVFGSSQIRELTLPSSVTTIEGNAFQWTPIQKIIIPKETVNIVGNPFKKSNSSATPLTIYCYENSAAHNTAVEYSIDFVLLDKLTFSGVTKAIEKVKSIDRTLYSDESLAVLDAVIDSVDVNSTSVTQAQLDEWEAAINDAIEKLEYKPADYFAVNEAINNAEEIDRALYTEESLAKLDEAVAAVDKTLNITNQSDVQKYADAITDAIEKLEFKPADYSAVNEAINNAEGIDRGLYTEESLAKLDEVVAAVDKTLNIMNQSDVQKYADAITDAIEKLEFKPADYSAVHNAVEKANDVNCILYSNASLMILEQSINAVDYTLNITQQSIVDGFADRIFNSIAALEYADVVLRDEPNGVVVSATAKEIYPTTSLAVDMLDPSNYETANFAVGGYIKSVQYYDINLIREGTKVQPNGTVYVKIRISDGVKPEKCRVYHVTEDPVDPLVRFTSTLDGNYIVFETDHFSEFAVIEVETYLSGISVSKIPSKLTYTINEKPDLSDMEITALYSDGKSEIITDYDVTNVDTSSIGTKTVTVYYTFGEITKSTSFVITVSADNIVADITCNGNSINEYNKKVKWYRGYSTETLQLACEIPDSEKYSIKWSSDNSKVIVDENGKVTNKGFFFPRKATITVTVTHSAGNIIATDSVVVRFYKFDFQFSGIQNVFSLLGKNSILFFLVK